MSMAQAITEIEVVEPAGRVKPFSPRQVSKGRLDRAARELNLLGVSSRGLTNVATIGQFIGELGLLKYGNGRLLGSAQMLTEAALVCADMAKKEGLDEESRRGYLELQLRFLKALDANFQRQFDVNRKAEESAASSVAPAGKSFLPGERISPIQINVSAGVIPEVKEPTPCKT